MVVWLAEESRGVRVDKRTKRLTEQKEKANHFTTWEEERRGKE